jgi:hypothetical protein
MLILISSIVAVSAVAAGFASGRLGTDSRPGFDERRAGERFGALR